MIGVLWRSRETSRMTLNFNLRRKFVTGVWMVLSQIKGYIATYK